MTWQWWAAITIYIVGAAGGMAYVGVKYQREMDRARTRHRASPLTIPSGIEDAKETAFLLCVCVAVWPIVSVLVVLYYGITAPFWLGKQIEGRKIERRRALAKQHQEQADNLRHMAQDFERGTTERQVLLDSARHLADKANKADTLK